MNYCTRQNVCAHVCVCVCVDIADGGRRCGMQHQQNPMRRRAAAAPSHPTKDLSLQFSPRSNIEMIVALCSRACVRACVLACVPRCIACYCGMARTRVQQTQTDSSRVRGRRNRPGLVVRRFTIVARRTAAATG